MISARCTSDGGHFSRRFRWLDNIRDWCVSRQLWWGHRIPAYYVSIAGEEKEPVVAPSREAALAKAAELHEVDASSITLRQDEDVLDTWCGGGHP
jgi:valyl-tRNA synthetase